MPFSLVSLAWRLIFKKGEARATKTLKITVHQIGGVMSKKMRKTWTFGHYTMRPLERADADTYYKCGFETPDAEANYYTGTTACYSKEQISAYVEKCVEDHARYDFIICSGEAIIGEVVLNEIEGTSGHYRICLFDKKHFSKGIGYEATTFVLAFAFGDIGLDSVTLEVFPFNERGIGLYGKLGFEVVEKIVDEEAQPPYRDSLVMRVTKKRFEEH